MRSNGTNMAAFSLFSAPPKRHTKMSANNLVQDVIHKMPDIAGPRMEFILPILLTNTPAWVHSWSRLENVDRIECTYSSIRECASWWTSHATRTNVKGNLMSSPLKIDLELVSAAKVIITQDLISLAIQSPRNPSHKAVRDSNQVPWWIDESFGELIFRGFRVVVAYYTRSRFFILYQYREIWRTFHLQWLKLGGLCHSFEISYTKPLINQDCYFGYS